jgi:hypothetical protein
MFPYIYDMDILIECLIPIMIDISSITKVMNSMFYMNEVGDTYIAFRIARLIRD